MDGLRQQRIFTSYVRIRSEGAVRHQRADPQTLLRRFFNAAERQRVDIDEPRRGLDLKLHEIDQIGAAGAELARRTRRDGAGGVDVARTFVVKRLHVRSPSTTSRIAATMLA